MEPKMDNYFFDQRPSHVYHRRPRKNTQEIPQSLRYAHLKPSMAEHLPSKSPSANRPASSNHSLPHISINYKIIKQQLDMKSEIDDDSLRFLFDEIKMNAPHILNQLGRFLYRFDNINSLVPNGLRYQIASNWGDLTDNVVVVPREWQTVAMKEYYQLNVVDKQDDDDIRSSPSVLDSVYSPALSARSDKSTVDMKKYAGSKYGSTQVSKFNLPEINEEDTANNLRMVTKKHSAVSVSRRSANYLGAAQRKGPRVSIIGETRSRMLDSRLSYAGIPEHAKSFYSVINFIYSSKQAEEKGWIVRKESEMDTEIRPTLEWCVTLLKTTRKPAESFENSEREQGKTRTPCVQVFTEVPKFYQPVKRSQISPPVLQNGLFPILPEEPPIFWTQNMLRSVITDGTTIIYYQSGRIAIVKSHAGLDRQGYYTFVYCDTPDVKLLACFTPRGAGSCYYSNGNISFNCTERGGHLAENNGSITRKWRWPPDGSKMSSPVILQLNEVVTFRCISQEQMYLQYHHVRDSLRINVSANPLEQGRIETRDKPEILMSTVVFASKYAKELRKPTLTSGRLSVKPSRKKKPVPSPDLGVTKEKIVKPHIAEATKMFSEQISSHEFLPEKDLLRIQTRVRGLVDDWLEHYRLAIGIPMDFTKNMPDKPILQKNRKVKSAKNEYEQALKMKQLHRGEVNMEEAKIKSKIRNASAPAAYHRHVHKSIDFATATVVVHHVTRHLKRLPLGTRRSGRASPERVDVEKPTTYTCPVSLRTQLLGHGRQPCRCSHHFLPFITDVEYTKFILEESPKYQLIIVFVISSLYPTSNAACEDMLQKIHVAQNKHRIQGCETARGDSFRIFKYDVATAAGGSDHTQPLLLTQHNVVPGMFLMYLDGQLIFCDHIFNGYGNTRQDFRKQITQCRHDAVGGKALPADFKFSPIKGRAGMRSAFGGEMGGAGVDGHGGVGTSLDARDDRPNLSRTSSMTTNSVELAMETKLPPARNTDMTPDRILTTVCLSPRSPIIQTRQFTPRRAIVT